MKKFIIFNWKMNLSSLSRVRKLAELTQKYAEKSQNKAEIVIAPSFVHLSDLLKSRKSKSKVALGAQDVFWANPPAGGGAYTGEISAKMLKNLDVEYVVIGHSERRQWLGETDEMVNKKVLAAFKAGLKVILCVGEPTQSAGQRGLKHRTTRKRNIGWAKNYVQKQLERDLKNIPLNSRLIIAYEPIWAIGTGRTDTPENAAETARLIKQTLNSKFFILTPRVLYGGSVNSRNIAGFLKRPEIDGALIGGASLKKSEVKKILETTANL